MRPILAAALLAPVLALGILTLAAAPARPAAAAIADGIGTDARAELDRIAAYLNTVRSLKGRFVQTGPDGSVAEGTLWLQRPGRLRFEYDPPAPLLVVADGTYVILNDRDVGQTTRYPIGATPLGLLVRETIGFTGRDVEVTGVQNLPGGLVRVDMLDPTDREQGALRLFLTEAPLTLRGWEVIDPQGLSTTVALSDLEPNVSVAAERFRFVQPTTGPSHTRR